MSFSTRDFVLRKTYVVLECIALEQLNARFAAGNNELAAAVRQDQDLQAESDVLQKEIIISMSKDAINRDRVLEGIKRSKLVSVKNARETLQSLLRETFPAYVELAKPQPLNIHQVQMLLADDEALIVFDFDAKSYAWVVTRTSADWAELPISTKDLDTQVKALRDSLTFDVDKPLTRSLLSPFTKKHSGRLLTRSPRKSGYRLSPTEL